MNQEITLDAVDRRILAELQRNARATYDELGALVGLAATTAMRRVRRLEETGVIVGYAAKLAPERVGLGLAAYISVRLTKIAEGAQRNPVELFAAAVQAWPEVVECSALSGDMDYLLHVRVRDMGHYSRFIMDQLLQHPAVQDCKTSFVLREFKRAAVIAL